MGHIVISYGDPNWYRVQKAAMLKLNLQTELPQGSGGCFWQQEDRICAALRRVLSKSMCLRNVLKWFHPSPWQHASLFWCVYTVLLSVTGLAGRQKKWADPQSPKQMTDILCTPARNYIRSQTGMLLWQQHQTDKMLMALVTPLPTAP